MRVNDIMLDAFFATLSESTTSSNLEHREDVRRGIEAAFNARWTGVDATKLVDVEIPTANPHEVVILHLLPGEGTLAERVVSSTVIEFRDLKGKTRASNGVLKRTMTLDKISGEHRSAKGNVYLYIDREAGSPRWDVFTGAVIIPDELTNPKGPNDAPNPTE